MPYTRDQLVLSVAERLGVAPDGQPPEAESAKRIRTALSAIVADLSGRDIFAFPNLDQIEDAGFLHLVAICAAALTDEFGLSGDEVTILASRAQAAEQKLRYLRSLPYARHPARPAYF